MQKALLPRARILYAVLSIMSASSCSLLDMGPLTITSWSPQETTLSSMDGIVIQIVFSRPVNTVLTEQAFSITADDSTLAGRVSWLDDRTLAFRPDEPLQQYVVYTMRVSRDAEDTRGRNLMPEFHHTFTTKSDLARPVVVSSTPADHASIDDPLTPFSATFSKPMDPGSVNTSFSLSPSVTGFYSMSSDDMTFTFTPTQKLQWQTRYTMTIEKNAADTQRNTIGADYTAHVFVGTDVTPPFVDSLQSADLALQLHAEDPSDSVLTVTEGWESTQGLLVTFSEQVSTSSAASAIQISPTVPYTVQESHAEYTSTLTYTFPERLAYGTTYSVIVTPGIQDAQGNQSTSQATYHFLVNGPATCPPTIAHVYFPSTPGDPAGNTELHAYDPIALPEVTAGETHTFFDLYIDCASGVALDRFSVAESFSVTTTNNAANIASFAIEPNPAQMNPLPDPAVNEIVERVWVHVTNNSASGQVVVRVSTDLKDDRETPLARELVLPLNDPN